MAPAENSSGNREINKLGMMAIAALATLAFGLGAWALNETSNLKADNAGLTQRIIASENSLLKLDQGIQTSNSELKAWLGKLSDKIDRISEAVGAKKP